ncbi:triosephosphate isomerase [Pseudogymnoascus sp. 05NY08]|nr:triosephosphate isomerase [Pseudogymnoascus sp. 05NY08]
MARQFFVGGNFKMNGSVQSIKKIISGLNEANLDPKVEGLLVWVKNGLEGLQQLLFVDLAASSSQRGREFLLPMLAVCPASLAVAGHYSLRITMVAQMTELPLAKLPPSICLPVQQHLEEPYLFPSKSFSSMNGVFSSEVVVAPPAIYLLLARAELRKEVEVAAQNVYDKNEGAFTGEISPAQLKDSNIGWTLIGHSERRVILKESDEFVASKTKNALDQGVRVILCCGESLDQREKGETVSVVTAQLGAVAKAITAEQWANVVIAYEPIWAIGTGKVATTAQAQDVHTALRQWLAKTISDKVAEETRIIYGGSVSEKNCKDLATQPDIDGFLVGGASLKPAFVDIVNARL